MPEPKVDVSFLIQLVKSEASDSVYRRFFVLDCYQKCNNATDFVDIFIERVLPSIGSTPSMVCELFRLNELIFPPDILLFSDLLRNLGVVTSGFSDAKMDEIAQTIFDSAELLGRSEESLLNEIPKKQSAIRAKLEVLYSRRGVSSQNAGKFHGDESTTNTTNEIQVLNSEKKRRLKKLQDKLNTIHANAQNAHVYQEVVRDFLDLLFSHELGNGKLEQPTVHGTERRDIIYVNKSTKPFFETLRNKHGNALLVFEVKNEEEVTIDDINQLAVYIGEKMGYCGFLVSRKSLPESRLLKAIAIYNNDRKVIISLADSDLIEMATKGMEGMDPGDVLEERYREFMSSLQ